MSLETGLKPVSVVFVKKLSFNYQHDRDNFIVVRKKYGEKEIEIRIKKKSNEFDFFVLVDTIVVDGGGGGHCRRCRRHTFDRLPRRRFARERHRRSRDETGSGSSPILPAQDFSSTDSNRWPEKELGSPFN